MANTIQTRRFGTLDYDPNDVLTLIGGLPGFPRLDKFFILENQEMMPFRFLQSIDNPEISFPLIDPAYARPDYNPRLSAQQTAPLLLNDPEEALIYCVVTLGKTPEEATVNLFAPIVINTRKMRGSQLMLSNSGYSVIEPLLKGPC